MKIKLIAFLIFLIIACCNKQPEENIQSRKIDSLLSETDTLTNKLKQLDIEFVLQLNDSLEKKMEQVENTRQLRRLRQTRNHLIVLLEWYDNLYRETIFAKNHLESIKNDIEKNALPDSIIGKELKSENIILTDLKERYEQQIILLKKRIKDTKRKFRNE